MMKTMLLGGAAAVVFIACSAMAASQSAVFTHKPARIFVTAAPPGSKTLYDQNKDDGDNAIFSQSFDNTQGADDFVVPKGHTWHIKEVDVTGIYFNGSGPATSENVFFYADNDGLPGDLIVACPNQIGAGGRFGSFAIVLSKSCKVKLGGSASLRAGKKSNGTIYWVSVQANIDFSFGGEWGWELSSDTNGNRAAWQSSDCPTWCHLDSDLMFALKGKDRH